MRGLWTPEASGGRLAGHPDGRALATSTGSRSPGPAAPGPELGELRQAASRQLVRTRCVPATVLGMKHPKTSARTPGGSPIVRAPTAVRELVCRLFVAQAKGGNRRLKSLCTLSTRHGAVSGQREGCRLHLASRSRVGDDKGPQGLRGLGDIFSEKGLKGPSSGVRIPRGQRGSSQRGA